MKSVSDTAGRAKRKRQAKAEVQSSGIPVFCAHSRIVPAAELVPHPENANLHPAKQLDRYEKVVTGNGWRRAIVVSKLSGRIIKGHGAWAMAKRRGWDVPVEDQAYRTPAEERRDMLADNRLAELAETDDEKLAKLLAGLGEGEIELSGYDSSEIERLLQESAVPDAEFPITAKLNERHDYVLIFCDNESDFVFLQTLTGVRPERSYKKTGVGLGRAIPFKKFLHRSTEPFRSGIAGLFIVISILKTALVPKLSNVSQKVEPPFTGISGYVKKPSMAEQLRAAIGSAKGL